MKSSNPEGSKYPFFSGHTVILTKAIKHFGHDIAQDNSFLPVLCDVYHDVCDHVAHLFQHYGEFWTKIDISHVNTLHIGKTIYDVVMKALGLSVAELHHETREKREEMMLFMCNEQFATVVDNLLKQVLHHLQAHPTLAPKTV